MLREINAGRESLFVHPKYIELLTGEENVWVFYAGVETDTVLEADALVDAAVRGARWVAVRRCAGAGGTRSVQRDAPAGKAVLRGTPPLRLTAAGRRF